MSGEITKASGLPLAEMQSAADAINMQKQFNRDIINLLSEALTRLGEVDWSLQTGEWVTAVEALPRKIREVSDKYQ